jgi:hypothetical protein
MMTESPAIQVYNSEAGYNLAMAADTAQDAAKVTPLRGYPAVLGQACGL